MASNPTPPVIPREKPLTSKLKMPPTERSTLLMGTAFKRTWKRYEIGRSWWRDDRPKAPASTSTTPVAKKQWWVSKQSFFNFFSVNYIDSTQTFLPNKESQTLSFSPNSSHSKRLNRPPPLLGPPIPDLAFGGIGQDAGTTAHQTLVQGMCQLVVLPEGVEISPGDTPR